MASRLALLAATGLLGSALSAQAADLGGDCCADLEERIAELEATTVRKGNRKVSLTISGQVNELLYWWDDGRETNAYVGTSGFSSTRFRFSGGAKITSDVKAGYYLEIEAVSAQVSGSDQGSDDGRGSALNIRHSYWYLESKSLGRISVGQQSHATDDITAAVGLGGTGSAVQGNLDGSPGASLRFRNSATGSLTSITARTLAQFLDSDRANLIRYDSPTVAGFVLSASWGEDDMWDVALSYGGEFGGFKIAARAGYHEERDFTGDAGANITVPGYGVMDFGEFRGAISVLHVPTGLFVDFGGIHREFDESFSVANAAGKSDFDYWFARGGIYQKFFSVGKTSIWGEYAEAEGALEGTFTTGDGSAKDKIAIYGVGVQQHIDAAAMEIYGGWRRFDADIANAAGSTPTDAIDTIYTGARIKF